jgi:uncharacterized protein (TIGR03083 family)
VEPGPGRLGTEPAPAGLRRRVLDAALASRPAGRPPATVAVSPVEGYRRVVAELAALLDELAPEEWSANVAVYGWTVQGLVGHIEAVERMLLDPGAATGTEPDHIAATLPTVEAQHGRSPAATRADWDDAATALQEVLATTPPDLADRVTLHGLPWRWGQLLVARSLEVWTHSDDIRRATGRPLAAPDAEVLALMTDLAIRTLPLRLALVGTFQGTARVVLTGPGGGAWSQPVRRGDAPGEPDVRLIADTVGFCRLSAGRLSADELGAHITGDRVLGEAILATAAAFAV